MKLYVKNKMVSIGDGSKVLDENKNPVFVVKGKIFTITHKKKIYDLNGELLYKVRSKYWHLLKRSAYIEDAKGHILMQLREKTSILGKGFDVLKSNDAYDIEWGGFVSGVNKVFRDDEMICAIERKVFALVDSFELEFNNPDDAALLVAMTIAIDIIYDKDSDD